jgi:hypothetical protein
MGGSGCTYVSRDVALHREEETGLKRSNPTIAIEFPQRASLARKVYLICRRTVPLRGSAPETSHSRSRTMPPPLRRRRLGGIARTRLFRSNGKIIDFDVGKNSQPAPEVGSGAGVSPSAHQCALQVLVLLTGSALCGLRGRATPAYGD